jgi:UDP-N-acetylmuramyl pentapeptide synthase
MRGELAQVAGRNLLIDCYNANPVSMAAALDALAELRGARRAVAVVGDMLELGDEGPSAHQEVGHRAAELGIAVIALGDERERVAAAARAGGGSAVSVTDPVAAARQVLEQTEPDDWILIKASRGMRLERVVEALRAAGAR